jgi:hypothetical protein
MLAYLRDHLITRFRPDFADILVPWQNRGGPRKFPIRSTATPKDSDETSGSDSLVCVKWRALVARVILTSDPDTVKLRRIHTR